MHGRAAALFLIGLLLVAGCVLPFSKGSGTGGESQVTPTPVACAAGTSDCQGICVDLDMDEEHCGQCWHACLPGQYCIWGNCTVGITCPEGQTRCGPYTCSDLQTDYFNCGACDAKCPSETPMQTCCNGTCRNLNKDTAHCGDCGLTCSPGLVCCDGNCVEPAANPCQCDPACPIGETCCNRRCVDLLRDRANCGKCGNACTGLYYLCMGGMCGHTIP